MNFNRFEHLNLAVEDLDTSRNFYQKLFPDWYVRAEGENEGKRWMHLGNHQFYVALTETPQAIRTHRPYDSIGINHVGFVIQDGDQMKAFLEANGIEYYTYTSPETKHRIYIDDPDGNEIELVEYQEHYPLK
ncbi:bleomycin resistance protein [Leptolyngbya sp. 'hensonii']|uniref:VOC family protein n=1 Tax=Leptolyngbya sp. 'hensonii' TaxID=1922337 RepID=UPI00094F8F10|nr:VOC family protein [Leptolyngbya sp. 'hensonii']OLP18166.1 bleomycin resistance protein [Leptolyngbya sp. 'hensonii']